jgi:hypothetical protein
MNRMKSRNRSRVGSNLAQRDWLNLHHWGYGNRATQK